MAKLAGPPVAARLATLALGAALTVAAFATSTARAAVSAGTEKDGQFVPGKSPSPQYGTDPGAKCQMTPIFRYVLDSLAEAAKRAKRPAPVADGQVCAVAESFLGWDPVDSGTPRPEVVTFVSHWFGLPSSVQVPVVATFPKLEERDIAERIAQSSAGTAALNAVRPRIGIAIQQVRKGRDLFQKVSVVVYDALLELAPVPRRLELGQKAVLSGKLAGGATDARVFVSDPTGKLSTPEQAPGDAFKAELACGDKPGKIQVEIRATFEGASGLAANFPVSCGQELPGAIALKGETWPTDPAQAEQKMLQALNAERQTAGAPPVKWDDAMAKIARSISEDLASHAAGGDVVQKLKAEGIASPLVLQSAAADRTYERALERILSSPRDRATVLEREANLVGIGTASHNDAEGRPLVYVTMVLIKELPPIDAAKVRQQLRDAVAQKRKDARTNAVAPDATLDEVAEKFAQALAAAGGTLPKEKATELTAPLNKSFRTVTMISGAKQEPLDFAEESQATAAGKSLGVGVAQGKHPVLGRNAVYVVLMVGTPRAGAAASEEASAASPKKKKAAGTKPAAPKK